MVRKPRDAVDVRGNIARCTGVSIGIPHTAESTGPIEHNHFCHWVLENFLAADFSALDDARYSSADDDNRLFGWFHRISRHNGRRLPARVTVEGGGTVDAMGRSTNCKSPRAREIREQKRTF